MYEFNTNNNALKYELNELVRQFAPFAESDFIVNHSFFEGEKAVNKISINNNEFVFEDEPILAQNSLILKRLTIRVCKLALYKALSAYFKRDLPWGALTGVRPTKLAYELLENGYKDNQIAAAMQKNFFVNTDKALLAQSIIANQKGYITRDKSLVNFYIHIPFCPSRCNYCSFISLPISKQQKYIQPYIAALKTEISKTAQILQNLGKTVYSVYIGGGTPTSISDELFEEVLSAIPYKNIEFTCEAGRPDTITTQKLALMKKYNVTRLSVNPQTLNDITLQKIGRNHTSEDFFNAYNLAREYDFVVNVDLIAGLPDETFLDFKASLDKVIELKPHNLTIHALSRKSGSILKEKGLPLNQQSNLTAELMMDYAYKKTQDDYLPYYLYRQKLTVANLENAGFTLKNFQCVNNITTMEESLSVIACGAGGISKIISDNPLGGDRIERLANIKDISLYLQNFDERLAQKELFCQNQFTI